MKSTLLITTLICCHYLSIAQTNTFPSSGSVGIGTTSPGQLIDVTGTGNVVSGTFKVNAIFTQDHTTYRGVTMGYDNSGQIGVIAASTLGPGSNLAFWSYTGSTWIESMRITPAGYLGIGTTAAGATLSLGSSVQHNKLSIFESGNYQWGFGIQNQQFEQYFASDNISNHISWGSMSYDGNHTFTEFMRLNGSGNLLIGKTTQNNTAYLLDVNGSARANAIVVNTSGADFVFDRKYKLHSLTSLDHYIKENHHLPEIESAKDMQINGLNLGENQTKLLQKVEELTLYLIQKDKKINEQQKEINALQEQLKLQEDHFKILEVAIQKLTDNKIKNQ